MNILLGTEHVTITIDSFHDFSCILNDAELAIALNNHILGLGGDLKVVSSSIDAKARVCCTLEAFNKVLDVLCTSLQPLVDFNQIKL